MNGYVYIFTNKSMPGILKIGHTHRSINERSAELYSTGVPTPFIINFYCETDDAPKLEQLVHKRLTKYRIQHNREFFKVDIAIAIQAVKEQILDSNLLAKSFAGRDNSLYLTSDEIKLIEEKNLILEKSKKDLEKKEAHRKLKIIEHSSTLDKYIKKLLPIYKVHDIKTKKFFSFAESPYQTGDRVGNSINNSKADKQHFIELAILYKEMVELKTLHPVIKKILLNSYNVQGYSANYFFSLKENFLNYKQKDYGTDQFEQYRPSHYLIGIFLAIKAPVFPI